MQTPNPKSQVPNKSNSFNLCNHILINVIRTSLEVPKENP
jgi:hypothetical protein